MPKNVLRTNQGRSSQDDSSGCPVPSLGRLTQVEVDAKLKVSLSPPNDNAVAVTLGLVSQDLQGLVREKSWDQDGHNRRETVVIFG